ncbi:MBL fold metallo-hydrolase [Methylophaga sp. OBS4]|nr:MBL fold metallo-hydrolase [Methylophaga sp. OBS4]
MQVLGSGGPEITDQRASSAYLIWQDGRARVLIDMGPGSMLRYEESGARLEDLDVILLSHLHVDHSADLPALIKGAFFTGRERDLPIYGPTGNQFMPNTKDFVQALFASPDGTFHYLDDYLTGNESYRLRAFNVEAVGDSPTKVIDDGRFHLTAVPVHHGSLPALAWRVDIAGKHLVFSGDMNGDNHTLELLAFNADLLVAHHAIPESMGGVARNLHMPPSVIGKIAAMASVKHVVLSHRMRRTIGLETESTEEIRKHYNGPLVFSEDGQCFAVE